jgi:Domain of unknown function (DUF5109)
LCLNGNQLRALPTELGRLSHLQMLLLCWTNSESFDRDMPLKFMPIKWEKLRLKLQAAQSAGITEAITFEFSHFMSPQSAYRQAGHLYNRYKDFLSTVST